MVHCCTRATISIQDQLYRYSYHQISVTIHRRIDVSNTALVNTGKMCQQLHLKIYTFWYTIKITGSPSELYNIYPCSFIHLIVAYTKVLLTVKVKSYCSLQIWVLSYILKSLTEEVWYHQATVTTHATISFSFSFVFSRDLYNTHYITYFMAHSFYVYLAPPIVVGVLLTCQSLDPEYKMTAFFQMYFQEKNLYSGQYGKYQECTKFNSLFAAARYIFNEQNEHVTPLFINLHWLPIAAHINFKALMFAYKSTTGSAPLYLNSVLQTYVPSRSLRSASERRFIVPSQRGTKSLSLNFKLNVPSWWNGIFRNRLKTHLFHLYLTL